MKTLKGVCGDLRDLEIGNATPVMQPPPSLLKEKFILKEELWNENDEGGGCLRDRALMVKVGEEGAKGGVLVVVGNPGSLPSTTRNPLCQPSPR